MEKRGWKEWGVEKRRAHYSSIKVGSDGLEGGGLVYRQTRVEETRRGIRDWMG